MNKITCICLGVKDMGRSIKFYRDGLGCKTDCTENNPPVCFFDTPGTKFELYPLGALARDIDENDPPKGSGFGGIVDGNKPLRGLGVHANYKNLEGVKAVTVATEASRTCYVDTEGAFWCWGRNKNGELGNGTTTDSPVPVKVEGLTVALTP